MSDQNLTSVLDLLQAGMGPARKRLDRVFIEESLQSFAVWIESIPLPRGLEAPPLRPPNRGATPMSPEVCTATMVELAACQLNRCEAEVTKIGRRSQQQAGFNRQIAVVTSEEERRRLILDRATSLGASPRQLRGDRAAFGRYFDEGAIGDRFDRLQGLSERRIVFLLDRVGLLCQFLGPALGEAWARLELEHRLEPLRVWEGDQRVREAAFGVLAAAIEVLPPDRRSEIVDLRTEAALFRAAQDRRQSPWVQARALEALVRTAPEHLVTIARQRFERPSDDPDIFVRRRLAELLARRCVDVRELEPLLDLVAGDQSPFVRQGLAETLVELPETLAATWCEKLLITDDSPQVRAAAAISLGSIAAHRPELLNQLAALLSSRLSEAEDDPFVQRVLAEVAADVGTLAVDQENGESQKLLAAAVDALRYRAKEIPVRRSAALARERLWCVCLPEARSLHRSLSEYLDGLPPGRSRRLQRGILDGHDPIVVGRVLSVMAQQDHGWDLELSRPRPRVMRGFDFRFRVWRVLHELRHPSPDKRQAHRHTIGRVFYGDVRAPSSILAELAETKVPGEPLVIGDEGGWRPYLPLVDDCLSCLNPIIKGRPVDIVSAEGVTRLRPPDSSLARLRAWLTLTWSFALFAKKRNWTEASSVSPRSYVESLEALGFELEIDGHEDRDKQRAVDPAVKRFFSLTLIPPDAVQRLYEYFVSIYENSLTDLLLFTGAVAGYFVGRHLVANIRFHRARTALPLVIGGWGTRGKSGTERIKAALLNGQGYSIVSKTTGCEAMFILNRPFGRMVEFFLYRPYDKATIWEQADVTRLAADLDADVLLWECMGLTPSYIQVLQHDWMRDDISTITNTYPDHEDLQGPAGIDIPQVMTRFLPSGAEVHCSEDQMLPILTEQARQVGTTMHPVSWLDAGLLTPDILERFPYQEHPYNIALVLSVARQLGIPMDVSLKDMADRVVADIGVLKTFPQAMVRSRRLSMSMGMSANERHGALSNWTRLAFDQQDPESQPGVWISTVVNNRADRIPRSRVFAAILVQDTAADRHFLIGGNLRGLLSYIKEAWQEASAQLTLFPSGEAQTDPSVELEQAVRRLRRPVNEATVQARLEVTARACLEGCIEDDQVEAAVSEVTEAFSDLDRVKSLLVQHGADEELARSAVVHLKEDLDDLSQYQALAEAVASGGQQEALDQRLHALCWKFFEAKLVVIWDYYAAGDQINDRIATETPPGFLNRIMGLQNIKGTGLDWVYRWLAWERCAAACSLLESEIPSEVEEGARQIATFGEHGVLTEERTRTAVARAQVSPAAQKDRVQTDLDLAEPNLEKSIKEIRSSLGTAGSEEATGVVQWAVAVLENILDLGDSRRRRRRADRIYRDLIDERISQQRAIIELQAITKRQKGGWLFKK